MIEPELEEFVVRRRLVVLSNSLATREVTAPHLVVATSEQAIQRFGDRLLAKVTPECDEPRVYTVNAAPITGPEKFVAQCSRCEEKTAIKLDITNSYALVKRCPICRKKSVFSVLLHFVNQSGQVSDEAVIREEALSVAGEVWAARRTEADKRAREREAKQAEIRDQRRREKQARDRLETAQIRKAEREQATIRAETARLQSCVYQPEIASWADVKAYASRMPIDVVEASAILADEIGALGYFPNGAQEAGEFVFESCSILLHGKGLSKRNSTNAGVAMALVEDYGPDILTLGQSIAALRFQDALRKRKRVSNLAKVGIGATLAALGVWGS